MLKSRSLSDGLLILALVVTPLAAVSASAPRVTSNHGVVSPRLVRGPEAISAGVTAGVTSGPDYGLFTCQLVNLNPAVTCYDPYQMRHAYNVDTLISAGLDGRGKTVVIIDAYQSPNIVQQLNVYNSFYGLPSLNGLGGPANSNLGSFTQIAPDGLTPFVTGDPNMAGWAEEISLDVLWAHAIAPGANITLVLAKSNMDADILSATQYAVDHHLGDVISQSFGENESCVDSSLLAAEHKLFVAATLKQITLVASTGDEGAAQQTCDGTSWVKAASSPASDPLVTAVGGTELHAARYCLAALGCDPSVNPAPGTYQGEVTWNEFGDSASGGGFSVLYGAPFYQFGSIPFRTKQRGAPDVGYSAAVLHGALTYLDIPGIPAGFYLFGGTSAGSPQWSAIVAIADQKAGWSLGFVNATLYVLGLFPNDYSAMFHDVTSGNNSVTEADINNNSVAIQGFNAGTRWDATTGLGSPKADQVLKFLTLFTSSDVGSQAIKNTDPNANGRAGNHEVREH